MSTTNITIENTINADTKKIGWEYWNQPEHIANWNFASEDWHCPKATNDLRVGGKLFFRMETKEGSFGFDFEGTYDEILPQKKIIYTITDGRAVNTTFEDFGEKTKVSTTFDAENQDPVEMQRSVWQAILDNFKK